MIRSKNYNYARILYQQRVEAVKKIRQGKPQNKFNYVREGVIKSIVEENKTTKNKIRKKHVKSEKQIEKEKLRGIKKAHDLARRKLKKEKIEALKNKYGVIDPDVEYNSRSYNMPRICKENPELLSSVKGRRYLKFLSVADHWGARVAQWFFTKPECCEICERKLTFEYVPNGATNSFVPKKDRINNFDTLPAIDHDHKLGTSSDFKKNPFLKPRGLLCQHCNRGLGCFKDDLKLLKKSVEYLEES